VVWRARSRAGWRTDVFFVDDAAVGHL